MALSTATTLNGADKGADLTLSSGNLVVTGTPVGDQLVRAIDSITSGKFYFEITGTLPGSDAAAGITNAAGTAANIGGPGTGCSIAYANFNSGALYSNNASAAKAIGAWGDGTRTLRVAGDADAKLIWFSLRDGTWNDALPGSDPRVGTGGLSFNALTGPYYPVIEAGGGQACHAAANFGATPFTGNPPAGFPQGTAAAPYAGAPTLNPGDHGPDLVLSNGNLTVTGTPSGSAQLVRGTTSQAVGRGYFEATFAPGAKASVGVCTRSATGPDIDTAAYGGATVSASFNGGAPFINGAPYSTYAIGDATNATVQVAYDLDARLIWFKKTTSPGWNGASSVAGSGEDPVGGTSSLGFAIIPGTMFPVVSIGAGQAGDSVTLNFGASPYLGTPPPGYVPSPDVSSEPASGSVSFAGRAPTAVGSAASYPASGMVSFAGFAPTVTAVIKPGGAIVMALG